MARLFISQDRLDRLIADDKVALEGDRLNVPALGASFRVEPAVYFTAVVDGDDARDLVGRVKSEASLRAIGADLLHTSAIVGETAYECRPGFLGEVESGGAWAARLGELPG